MKIKNKFIIPVIAIFVALIMVGSPATIVAVDTEASETTEETTTINPADHEYTYKTTTAAPTSSLEEEIEGAVSDILGGVDENLGDTIRDAANTSGGMLRGVRSIINMIINFFDKIGDFLAGEFRLSDIINSMKATTETTIAK